MRVNSGLLKNRSLASPAGSSVRPTSDKVRAAIFSSLGEELESSSFLDLFAGSGSVGIEAYSRGARYITFVESSPDVAFQTNMRLLPSEAYKVIKGDFFKIKLSGKFDIIFIDPPYDAYSPKEILEHIKEQELLAENGTIVYEESYRAKTDWDNVPFNKIKERRYGDTLVVYLSN